MKLPNPEPLKQALQTVMALQQKTVAIADEKTRLEKETEAFVTQGAPGDDEARVMKIVGAEMRLKALPRVQTNLESEIEASLSPLIKEIEGFERALAKAASEERLTVVDKWEDVLLPATAGDRALARNLACSLPICKAFPVTWDQLPAPKISASGIFAHELTSAIERAQALLSIHKLASSDESFLPAGFRKA